jgi:CDGSH-type Zn-finger protein
MLRCRADGDGREACGVADGDEPRIQIQKDGPYLLQGGLPIRRWIIGCDEQGTALEWVAGEEVPTPGESYALCRCGKSGNKPFCDGSHIIEGFDGTETANRTLYLQHAEVLDGPRVTVTDDRDLCAEARFCDAHGGLWNRVGKADDAEEAAGVVAQARLCPGGRYTPWDNASGVALEPDLEPSVGLVEDPSLECSGPLWVRGGVPVTSADGTMYEVRNRVTLCRCGASCNKPFCDGTHIGTHFTDER